MTQGFVQPGRRLDRLRTSGSTGSPATPWVITAIRGDRDRQCGRLEANLVGRVNARHLPVELHLVAHRTGHHPLGDDLDRHLFHRLDPRAGPGRVSVRTSPQQEAGIRIDPPPSFAWLIGTTPAATSAAEPPDDPPTLWSRTPRVAGGPVVQGLRGGGEGDPAVRSCRGCRKPSSCASVPPSEWALPPAWGTAREPNVVGYPGRSSLSFRTWGHRRTVHRWKCPPPRSPPH